MKHKKSKKRRNPSENNRKLPNKILDEDHPFNESIRGYKELFYSKKFNELLELKGIWISDLNRFGSDATKPVTAYYVGMSIRYDQYYLHFIFLYESFIYTFAWETPFDEWHRVLDKRDKYRTWYDKIKENMGFRIFITPDNPAQFRIIDNNFKMNDGVIFLGKWDRLFNKNIITYQARKLGKPAYRYQNLIACLWYTIRYELSYRGVGDFF